MEDRGRERAVRRATLSLVGVAVASTVASAAPTGRVTAGWPVRSIVADGIVLRPGVGPVVYNEVHPDGFTAASFNSTGRRLWRATSWWSCGNCPPFPPDRTRPIGGPIGSFGGSPYDGGNWLRVDGSMIGPGVAAFTNGMTITYAIDEQPAGASVLTTRGSGAGVSWSRTDPFPVLLEDDGNVSTSPVITNGTTTLYRGLQELVTPSIALQTPMQSLDPTSGVLRWQVANAVPVATWGDGVVAFVRDRGYVGYDVAGNEIFQYVPSGTARFLAASPVTNAIFLSDESDRIMAVNTVTGAVSWMTPAAQNLHWLSVTPTGVVLAALTIPGTPTPRYGLRAIAPNGAALWRFDTTGPVSAARSLNDGTIALTVLGAGSSATTGLLLRINPQVAPVRWATTSVRTATRLLSRDTGQRPPFSARSGVVVRLQSPRAGVMSFRLLPTTRAATTAERRWQAFPVPAGTSWTRIDVPWSFMPSAAARVQVRHGLQGAIVLDRRIPFTAR
jgi:hypothetical protein